jgi:hypothetical protein
MTVCDNRLAEDVASGAFRNNFLICKLNNKENAMQFN